MPLNTLKDVTILLDAIRNNNQQIINALDSGDDSYYKYLAATNKTFKESPEKYVGELKTEIHTLETVITILEKEQHDAN